MTEVLTTKTTLQHNKELSDIFKKMSECYRYLGPKERFRAIAYETAAKTLNNLSEPVDIYHDDIKKLDELKGVGESIASKIIEYLDDGSINTFEQLKLQVPYALLDLMDVEGIGAATIKKIHNELNVTSIKALKDKIIKEQILSIKGVSKSQMQNINAYLAIRPYDEKRINLAAAIEIGNKIMKALNLKKGVEKTILAGSIRRKKETIGDIDIVILADKKNNLPIIQYFTKLPLVKEIISAGNRKASVWLNENDIKADVQIVSKEEFGSSILYFTGSKEHNIALRSMARKKGWKLNEYGLFDLTLKKKIAGETEEGIYASLGLKYIPPEERTGKNEFSGKYAIT